METGKVKSLSVFDKHQSRVEVPLQAKTTHVHSSRTREEGLRLVHEFEARQIELETQILKLCKAKEGVEKTLRLYTDLFDFSPVGYFTITRNGKIRNVNRTGAGLVGSEPYKLSGSSFMRLVKDEYRTEIKSFLNLAFASRRKETCEAVLLDKENLPRYVQIEAKINDSGQACHLVLIDISDRIEPPAVYTPGYTAEDEYALMETNLYNAGNNKLIWSAASETEIFGSNQDQIKSYIGVMVDAMSDQELLR
ncbi:MAG: PAS domain S-box protein [Geobacter sp.]|nr:PAS domain S-box protein [Geobacter sp.]